MAEEFNWEKDPIERTWLEDDIRLNENQFKKAAGVTEVSELGLRVMKNGEIYIDGVLTEDNGPVATALRKIFNDKQE